MTKSRTLLIAGAAALALAGATAIANAQAVHEIAVQLPGGGVEHIRYVGDAKPVVVMLPADPFAAAFAQPGWPSFAQFDQMQAQMDRQMNAMLTQARAMQQAAQSGTLNASFGNLPRGRVQYTQISISNGKNMCTRTVRTMQPEAGGQLQTVSSTSGDCGGNAPAAHAPTPASDVIQAKATAAPHHTQPTRT